MSQKKATIMAGMLAAVILILLFPLWKSMAWSSPIESPAQKTVSGTAIAKDVVSGGAVSGGAISGTAVQGENVLIQADGTTLETRLQTPAGYERTQVEEISFASFLRTYPMRKDKAKIKLYNGQKKERQDNHVAILKLPLDKTNLQQATSSIQRVVAEYFWKQAQYDKISFRYGNGFQADYVRWREGYRISNQATGTSWVEQGTYDRSYSTFARYLQAVFLKTSAATLEQESQKTTLAKVKAGDILLKRGTGSHVVMVVDVCENAEGKKAYLLAQGGTPAQQFHVIKNPAHENDPWYYEEEMTATVRTPDVEFAKGSFRSLNYFSE